MNYFQYYKEQANNNDLSDTEKCGRHAKQQQDELFIFQDVKRKLPALNQPKSFIIDIGCGCSEPVKNLLVNSSELNQELILVDSEEMLAHIPEQENVTKVACQFPNNAFISKYENKADAIIVYSVFHYIYLSNDFITFVDSLVLLLAPGGSLLLADLPNIAKKKRFLSSDSGKKFHQNWSGDDSIPEVHWNQFELGSLDDSTIFMLFMRYRQMGFETYLVPQDHRLPFSNTREDLLVRKW